MRHCDILLINSLILVILLISYHNKNYRQDYEKLSAYECGFQPFGDARSFFDAHFYIIGLIFLIFDLEVFFLVPFVVDVYNTSLFEFFNFCIFLVFILVGFVFE